MNIFCKLVFFIITAVIASTPAKTAEVSDKLKIIFRYDDYSKYTSMEVADSLIKAARDVGSGVLVGVIPFPYCEYPEYHEPFDPTDPESPAKWEAFNYELACAELCGTGHYSMRKLVRIVSEKEYEEWLATNSSYYLTNIKGTNKDPLMESEL